MQRAYGQTPYVTVPNQPLQVLRRLRQELLRLQTPGRSSGRPCADTDWAGAGRASCSSQRCPVSSWAFHNGPRRGDVRLRSATPVLVLFVLVSIGLFYAVEAVSPLSPAMVAVIYVALGR